MRALRTAIMGLILAGAVQATHAATVIAVYDFDGTSLLTSDDTELNSTAGSFGHDFLAGAGTTGADVGRSSSQGLYYIRSNVTDGTDEASSIAGDDYMTFTVTPGAGYKLDLSTLTFAFSAQRNSSGIPTGFYPFTTNVFLRTSLDGFAATIPGSTASKTILNSSTTTTTVDTVTATFGSAYDAVTSAIEFRLYVYDNRNMVEGFTRVDTVTLNGDVLAIPEPATLALLAVGAVGAVARRRR